MSFLYQFGGLILSAPVAIPGLHSIPPASLLAPDITISVLRQPSPPADRVLFRSPGLFQLVIGTLEAAWYFSGNFPGAFLLSPDGHHITAYLEDEAKSSRFWDVLVRRILPRSVFLFGRMSIHAASVADSQGAILLLGFSGAGKSTFSAAAAHLLNLTLLSDDISVLQHAEVPALSPAAHGISLMMDSREALGISQNHCRPHPVADDKLLFQPAQHILAGQSYPLRAFVTLNRLQECTAPHLEPLGIVEGLGSAYTQMIKFNPGNSSSPEAAHSFQSLASVLQQVPSYRFDYPADFGALRSSVEKLAELL